MYKEFYGLIENPFKLSPSVQNFFITPKIKNIITTLHYGLNQNIGFMVITGEVGVGKTSLLRYFMSLLDSNVERAYLFHPTFTHSEDLLRFLLMDLEFNKEVGEDIDNISKARLLQKIYQFLLRKSQENKKVLLIVDDSQSLSPNMLEELRLLSNFETNEEKLIQILLIGQPELRQKLKQKSLRQLAQRIGIQIEMKPFSLDETCAYINHRLLKAGTQHNLFDQKAIKLIHKKSKGLPRVINLLAERSLVAGYLNSKATIGKQEVKQAIKECNL
ncbi:ExeA family protein [Desulfothermus sp.]